MAGLKKSDAKVTGFQMTGSQESDFKETGSQISDLQESDFKKTGSQKNNPGVSRPVGLDFLTFIHSWLLLSGTFPLIASAIGLTGVDWWIFTMYSLVIPGAAAVSFFAVRRTRKLAVYVGVSAAYIALAVYGGQLLTGGMVSYAKGAVEILTLIFCTLVFLIRLNARLRQSRLQQDFASQHAELENVLLESWEASVFLNHPGPLQWIWPVLLYFPAVFASFRTCYRLMFVMLIADIFVTFLYSYLEQFYNYIRDHHRIANMPLVMMKKVHRMLMITALLLISAAILPAVCYHTEPLDGWKPEIKITMPEQAEEEIMECEGDADGNDLLNALAEEDPWVPPQWLVKAFRVMTYLLLTAALIGIAWIIWQRLKETGRDFAQEDEDEVIFLDDAAEETAMQLYGGKKKTESFLSPNAQIRRRYRKAIQKGIAGRPNSWETPGELEQSARWKQTEEEQVLHELYEKARYSGRECDRIDLDRLK